MDELLTWDMLIGREHGPLAFRLVLQPKVAALLAIRAGVRDAKAGRPPHGWGRSPPIPSAAANCSPRAGTTSPDSFSWRSLSI
jgi:hypothetical protein